MKVLHFDITVKILVLVGDSNLAWFKFSFPIKNSYSYMLEGEMANSMEKRFLNYIAWLGSLSLVTFSSLTELNDNESSRITNILCRVFYSYTIQLTLFGKELPLQIVFQRVVALI